MGNLAAAKCLGRSQEKKSWGMKHAAVEQPRINRAIRQNYYDRHVDSVFLIKDIFTSKNIYAKGKENKSRFQFVWDQGGLANTLPTLGKR